jgi:hypothetical protein
VVLLVGGHTVVRERERESVLIDRLILPPLPPPQTHTHTHAPIAGISSSRQHKALCEENCLDVLQYADAYDLPNLKTVALAKIARCFDRLGLGGGGEGKGVGGEEGEAAAGAASLPPHLVAEVRALGRETCVGGEGLVRCCLVL